jgi:LmbE family N-acetylglucosaminyl deacetylase
VLDAVFPAARDHLYFPELWQVEELEPHIVHEVWVSLPKEPNVVLDVTVYWETKIRALYEHKSQIGDPEELAERLRSRHTPESTRENPVYVEQFHRIVMA